MRSCGIILTLASSSALIGLSGCGSNPRTIRVPENVLSDPAKPTPAEKPYVIKMSDGRRTWQIEIPAGAGAPAFEASIPLEMGVDASPSSNPPATEADREILDAKRARGEPVTSTPGPEGQTGPPSYLKSLAKVRALFGRRSYELALVELVRLERSYPEDLRILQMKGTLQSRLGQRAEARMTWERALALSPDDPVLLRALEALEEGAD